MAAGSQRSFTMENHTDIHTLLHIVTNRSSATLTLSTSSSRSRSTIYAEKQAKAEAATFKITFLQQEAELRKKQAILKKQQALAQSKKSGYKRQK
ncbi:hypothetical protein DPMN_148862 [Dreissena polymorpha]|uniref:Uncharacterized protein n=1 Tax=Dreissena polymorpha TaxID=45954 RepID=A0A9D4FBP9_DREPO|nr:hypothetical protein DPMN_148862 [Dreissena polymorpha]